MTDPFQIAYMSAEAKVIQGEAGGKKTGKSSLKVDLERTKSDATRGRGRLMALVTFTLGNNQVQAC